MGGGQPVAALARRRTVGGGGLYALAVGDHCSAGLWVLPPHHGLHSWSGTWYGPPLEAPSLTLCLWLLDPTTPCLGLPGFVSSSTSDPESCVSACESAGLGAAGEWSHRPEFLLGGRPIIIGLCFSGNLGLSWWVCCV